jgi:hypothetical protein
MITYLATVHKVRSDCLDCQGVTQKTIKELLSNLKSQARKKRSKN